MPCGADVPKTLSELGDVQALPGWDDLPAVRNGRLYAVNAGAYFSRSGPRLVDGLALLAQIIQPELFPWTVPARHRRPRPRARRYPRKSRPDGRPWRECGNAEPIRHWRSSGMPNVALHDDWAWHIGDWACLTKEHPDERDICLVEYVWEGLLEVRVTGAAPLDPPLREPAERFFPLPSWERGRDWLRHHGWGFPYCTTDRMTITWFFEPFETDLDELLSAQGLTDLECLYQ